MYHHVKFHADQRHRRRAICNGTDTKITADLISDETYSSVAFVGNYTVRLHKHLL